MRGTKGPKTLVEKESTPTTIAADVLSIRDEPTR